MTNQWFFAAVLQASIAVQFLIKSFTSEFIFGQYIASLALRYYVSDPRWLACILVTLAGRNTFGMMTQFPLNITPL